MKISKTALTVAGFVSISLFVFPEIGFCDLVNTLNNVQTMLVNRLAPVIGILSLCWAGFSYLSGNPNARGHLIAAIVGACLLFGAETILRFIQSYVK